MRIGLDIMGGDFAPRATMLGALSVLRDLDDHQLVLFGDQDQALTILKEQNADPSVFDFVHTTEVIGMSEHPAKAITQRNNSSIHLGLRHLAEGKIDSFASAGNTGALLVGSIFSVKTIPGIIRPAIPAYIPKLDGAPGVMLDVGANVDCKPDVLAQFALLGSLYTQHVCKIAEPKVGLINIGEEAEKGNVVAQAAYTLMKDLKTFRFVGNVEGRDLFSDKADVFVCDGFIGNIILKLGESFYNIALKKGLNDDFFNHLNYEQYGGSPILGINAPVIIGHGISNAEAIRNMVLLSKKIIETDLVNKIKKAFI